MPGHTRSPLRAALLLLLLCGAAAAHLPASASGHGGGIPWIYVEAQQVWPGQPFHVLVIDVAPFVTVRLQADLGDTTAQLGELPTGRQGHGEMDVALPADFPFGYATLRGLGDDGSEVNTTLRVGDVPAIDVPVGPPPGAQPPPSPLTDPSLWTLGLIVGGALLAVGWMAIRRRRVVPAPVPAAQVGALASATPARLGKARKGASGYRRRPSRPTDPR